MINLGVKMKEIKENIKKQISLAHEISKEIEGLDETYRLRAFEIISSYLLDKQGFVSTLPSAISHNNSTVNLSPEIKTFASFLRRLDAKSHADKVLSIAYFCNKVKNSASLTKDDIEVEYKAALIPKSKNTTAEINSLIQRGYVMLNDDKIEGKRSFTITADGITYIEEKLLKKNDKN
jgi:hypothetical protein